MAPLAGAVQNKNANPVICVFCGSSSGSSPAHMEAARDLARAFHKHNISLVYGGGTVGLMGELARTLVSLSGPDSVHGVIPSALLPLEAQRRDSERTANGVVASGVDLTSELTLLSSNTTRDIATPDEAVFGRTTVVADMHTRKRLMASLVLEGGPGSGFVALSGGYGTLEELMEIVTWNQLGIHDRGVCVFNVEGYWDGIMAWVREAVDKGFVQFGNRGIMVEATTADGVVEALGKYKVSEGRFRLHWEDEKKN